MLRLGTRLHNINSNKIKIKKIISINNVNINNRYSTYKGNRVIYIYT